MLYDFTGPDVIGGYGFLNTSYDQPMYDGMPALDLASAGQAVETVGVNDGWGGWLKTIAQTAIDYTIKKDAAQTGVQLRQTRPNGYQQTGASAQRGGQISPLLLIIGAVAVVLLVQK